ncbi:unnamed protein product [Echinostoma caproni]|uniref:WH2 domain-containing protein n=1 Tax=Echinostoma caproni TaxID=27848 RepID=A0A183A7B8_9TREM|nr:unnamed protein product [Echinostoma caproni]
MFCFRTKRSPDIYDNKPPPRPVYMGCLRNPQPPVTVQIVEPPPPPAPLKDPEPVERQEVNKGDDVDEAPPRPSKRVMTRAELRKLQAQSNLQLYKFSLPLVGDG